MKRKTLALLLAGAMTLSLLAGCGKDSGSTPSSNPGGTPSDSGGSGEVTDITLKVWCPSNQIDTGIMAEQQKAFEAEQS